MSLESVPPKYAQLVHELQRRIESGTYPPGEMMPSEHQLIQEFGVSRPTVVAALRVLREQGWVESRQGKGRFVLGRPVLAGLDQVRPGAARLVKAEDESSGEVFQIGAVAAPNRIATLLGVKPRSKVFLRRRIVQREGEPSESVSVWLPLKLSEGTDLTSMSALPQGIKDHLEARKGVRLDHVVEHVVARTPDAGEKRDLAISGGVPLLLVYATVRDASGDSLLVVEVALPADRHELEDAYPLH